MTGFLKYLSIFVKHPYKRVRMSPKFEIFVDLNRAGHEKSVLKNN